MWQRLKGRIHISWHIAWFGTGVVVGAALALAVPPEVLDSAAWLAAGLALCVVVVIRPIMACVAVALLAGTIIGGWRGAATLQLFVQYRAYDKQQVTVSGLVSDDAVYDSHGDQRLQLRGITIAQRPMPGTVWVGLRRHADIKRGDTITVRGVLDKGFGGVPAVMYRAETLAIRRPDPGDVARRARDRFATGLRRVVGEPQSSLGMGFLTGQHNVLPQDLEAGLRLAGLTHIVVASGYNLTVLMRAARRLLARISKYLTALASTTLIIGFMLVTGLSPSMSRAGLVAGLSLLAWYYGRTIHPLVLQPVAAAITVLIHPAYLWGDLGWYLSFLAFAGVLVLSPLLQHYFWGTARTGLLRQIVLDTISAQLLTLPIIIFTFEKYPAYALLANLLVVPFVPLAMVLTFAAGIAGVAGVTAGGIAGWPAYLVLHYITGVIEWVAALPDAQRELHITAILLVGSYIALCTGMVYLQRATRHSFRTGSLAE